MSIHSINYSPPLHDSKSNSLLAIKASGLSKIYKDTNRVPAKQALDNLTLEIPQGCVFGLLGPNGAGKSTFINILAGTVIKTSGQVSVWGADLDTNPRQVLSLIHI